MILRITKKNMNSIYFSEIVCAGEEVLFQLTSFLNSAHEIHVLSKNKKKDKNKNILAR